MNLSERLWLIPFIRGILAILFGLALFFFPKISLIFMITLFGAFLLISGLSSLFIGLFQSENRRLWRTYLPDALVSILIGCLVFFWPEMTGRILLYMIGAWALISGILQLVNAFKLKEWFGPFLLNGLTGIFLTLFGLVLFLHPGAGAVAISFIIGAVSIFYGVLSLGIGTQLKKAKIGTF